jgi:hypothetical protein
MPPLVNGRKQQSETASHAAAEENPSDNKVAQPTSHW